MIENTKTTAIDAYFIKIGIIQDQIEQLKALADNHFGHDADSIHWGHVGDLGRVENALHELLAIF